MKKLKVYCENCKFYRFLDTKKDLVSKSSLVRPEHCIYQVDSDSNYYSKKRYTTLSGKPSELNKNNNCKYYSSKKWWKIIAYKIWRF